MLQRLQIEWMKLRNYRTFWILFGLYLASIAGANYIAYRIQQNIYEAKEAKGMAEMLIGTPPYAFPNVWHMTSYVSSFLLFLPGLLMIISVTNEYNFKTHRQNIIDGWSRHQFITVKLASAVILAALSTVMVTLTALVFGLINREPFSAEKMIYLFYFFIQALSYTLVALLFSLLFRRGGLAIGIFFMYALVLENVAAGLMNRYLNYTGRYLPLESTDNLVPLPIFESVQRQMLRPYNTTALLIFAVIYLAAYFYFSYRKFETDDL
jgi:ABC-2 type transport system permease protein